MKSFDVVIPVYNEERILAQSVETLRSFLRESFPYRWRIVIADNASTDGTLGIAEELARRAPDEVRVLHLDEKGRGRALKRAWLDSDADAMGYMDVDLSTDIAKTVDLARAVLDEGYDLAYGSRLARGAETTRSLKREIVSRGNMAVIKALFLVRFSDAQCGFKAITREAARALLPLVRDTYWFFDTELLIKAEKAGYRLKEIPVRWQEDPDTRVKLVQDIAKQLRGLLRVRFERIPRREELVST
ncbi:MAG TPA: dolichyl-phosphate beta-glucosyltransferase [Dehalococcoidia bacterium]|nr:dolichyl-phosphate beta-glucosyltransferase [Dehalococcoidia bacterium]